MKWFLSAVIAVISGIVFAQTQETVKQVKTEAVIEKDAPAAAAESQIVTVAEIEDMRKTKKDGFPAGLKVTLNVSGIEVDKVKNVECSLTAANDDSGKSLIKKEKGFFDKTEFRLDENSESAEVEIKLRNPSRKAATIKLEGTIDMFVPANDPAATIKVVNAKKTAGVPVKSEALQAAKASVLIVAPKKEKEESKTAAKEEAKIEENDDASEADLAKGMAEAFSGMFSMGGGPNSVTLEIKDPEGKIQSIEFFDSTGKEIKSNGSSSMGDAKVKLTKNLDFNSPLPETAEMRIYVATPKAEKKIPFNLTNVALP